MGRWFEGRSYIRRDAPRYGGSTGKRMAPQRGLAFLSGGFVIESAAIYMVQPGIERWPIGDSLEIKMSTSKNQPKVSVYAEKLVAYDSPDHLIPHGTARDSSKNFRFNHKIYDLYRAKFNAGELKVLDLGCSGGGFVRSILDSGNLGVGVEGSDYSQKHKRAEWANIPEFLFTADITKRFDVSIAAEAGSQPVKFDVITMWEVLEHIPEADLAMLSDNIKRHLAPGGLWIVSIANYDYFVEGVNLHQTVKPKDWWVKMFTRLGLTHIEPMLPYFGGHFVRGAVTETEQEFHLVLSPNPAQAPKVPELPWNRKLFYSWADSRVRRAIHRRLNLLEA